MPTGLVLLGSIITIAVGGLIFLVLRRHKSVEPLHFK